MLYDATNGAYPVNEIVLARAALAPQVEQRWKKEERGAGGALPFRVGRTRLVARFASHFELFLFPFRDSFFLSFLHLHLLLLLANILLFPLPSISGSFPRFWLSLSSAIRQSSCQIKFAGEQSPRSARRIPCNRGDDKKWMLRNFRIGKTREKCIFTRLTRPPPVLCRFLLLDWYIFYSRGRCLLFFRATPTRFSLRSPCEINACLRDRRASLFILR